MEDEELETYETVSTEDYTDDYEEGSLFEDIAFFTFLTLLGCFVFAFVLKTVKKHTKNIHLKIGNKIEVGVESKE